LNARYYNGVQGQFISEDPVFLGGQQNLQDPQSLNAYSYSEDNPIIKEDPTGKYYDISFAATCSCLGPELPGPSAGAGACEPPTSALPAVIASAIELGK
jgi:hypothetical protein